MVVGFVDLAAGLPVNKKGKKMKNLTILCKKLHPDAIIPQYQTEGAACFDFHALVPTLEQSNIFVQIPPGKQVIVRTGIQMNIPDGYEIQVRSRSGLAAKKKIIVSNSPGTIDSDYLNEIFIILMNMGDEIFCINNGDRIAQGCIKKVLKADISEVDHFDADVFKKDRGGGLGSTGMK